MIELQEFITNNFIKISIIFDVSICSSILIAFIMFFKEGESLKEIVKTIYLPLLPAITILILVATTDPLPQTSKVSQIAGITIRKEYYLVPSWGGSFVKIVSTYNGKEVITREYCSQYGQNIKNTDCWAKVPKLDY